MYGASTGSLRVWGKSENGSYSKLWERSGDHGSTWHSAIVNFTHGSLLKVMCYINMYIDETHMFLFFGNLLYSVVKKALQSGIDSS